MTAPISQAVGAFIIKNTHCAGFLFQLNSFIRASTKRAVSRLFGACFFM